jgi:hypothetical protein
MLQIIVSNLSTEQVSHFNYLGSDTSCKAKYEVYHKMYQYQGMCGVISRVFQQVRKETVLKCYEVLAVSTLFHMEV